MNLLKSALSLCAAVINLHPITDTTPFETLQVIKRMLPEGLYKIEENRLYGFAIVYREDAMVIEYDRKEFVLKAPDQIPWDWGWAWSDDTLTATLDEGTLTIISHSSHDHGDSDALIRIQFRGNEPIHISFEHRLLRGWSNKKGETYEFSGPIRHVSGPDV